MNKFYYKIIFCFCFFIFSLAYAADISIEGITDKTNVNNDVTFRITSEPGHSYSSFLDDKIIPEDKWITVSKPGYHQINVTRINGQTISNVVRFNINSDRGSSEWGLFPWTPQRPIESSSNECKSSELIIIAPANYPSESPIPLVAITADQSSQWKRINGYVKIDELNNSSILLKRGVGYAFLSETNAGTFLNLNPTIKSSGTNVLIKIDSSQNWSTISENITTNTIWSKNSRIKIQNNIEVSSGVTLTIESGCIIFLDSIVEIIVNGNLIINGNIEMPVVFAPITQTNPWGGFIFSNSVSTVNINGAIFTGSGSIKKWMAGHGYNSHRQEQALFLLDSISKITLSNVFIIENSGQAFHGQNASLNAFNCLIQKCSTVGQFNSSTCSFYNSAMIDFPCYDDSFSDADNDGIYMSKGVLQINNSLIGWAKDDGIDAGTGGNGKVDIENCWIESCFHEGGAFSSHPDTKTINIVDSVFLNNGQGIEAGYGSPFVYVDNCLLINNEIGLRFGDNYPWGQNGYLNVTNSISIFNYKDYWNMCHLSWTPKPDSTLITGNIFSKSDTNYTNNEVWNGSLHSNKLIPFIKKASALGDVGIGFSTSLSNYINDDVTIDIPVNLSMVSTNSIIVEYLILGITNSSSRILEENFLEFMPGEFCKNISFSMKNFPYETVPDSIEISLTKSINAEISYSQNRFVYFITNINKLIISELHYNPLSSQSNESEFIELYNSGWELINFSNLFLNEYSFPTNETLESGKFIVIAKNASYYSNQCSHLLEWPSLNLSDTGQTIRLLDKKSNIIDYVTYSNISPWPSEPDGTGPSLELINVYNDNSQPESWTPSTYNGGTPGEHRIIPEPSFLNISVIIFAFFYLLFYRKLSSFKKVTNTFLLIVSLIFSNSLLADETNEIIINEVMADNNSIFADEYGEFHDWIEIYNAGDESVNLKGYGLSDKKSELFKWSFPDIELQSNSYLVVFASKQNRTNGTIHTNFKLDSKGETLSLTLPNSNLLDRIEFNKIPTDVSMGKKPVGSSELFYFTTPTPGTENTSESFSGMCSEPEFSSPGGFVAPFFLILSSDSDDEIIHYTLDGSVPTELSAVYSSPIWITGTTVVSAVCYKSDCIPGTVVSHSYYSVFPDILTSTRLPVVVVETLGQAIDDEPKIRARMSIIYNGENNLNNISAPFNEFDGWIGIEYRGQTSQGFPKKQFGIETRDEIDRNLNVSLFGFPKENDWILYAPYSDKTLMRNVLAYSIAEDMGQYASRTKYCELILNGEYRGVYVFMEKLKHDKNRVDLSDLHTYQLSEPEISGGYFLKTDKEASQFKTPSNIWMTILSPEGITIPTTQKNWIKNYVYNFEAALAASDFTNQTTGYSKYINVDSFIDYYLIIQALRNIDGFRISTYYCKERNEKLKMGPIWDFNIALGNVNYYDGWETNGWYHSGSYFPFWWIRLLDDPNYLEKCKIRWKELRKNVLDSNVLIKKIDAITNQLEFAQQRNFEKWNNILGSYVWPNPVGYRDRDTYEKEVTWMKDWLIGRLNWIDYEFDSFFANFYSSKQIAFVDEEIQFYNSAAGNPQSYSWNFGVGSTDSIEQNPVYSYSSEGLYTISLTISNNLMTDTCVKTNFITIVPEPISFYLFFLLLAGGLTTTRIVV